MRYQTQVIQVTAAAAERLYRVCRNVPPDRVHWRPLERGDSILELLQQQAQFPRGITAILRVRGIPRLSEKDVERIQQEQEMLISLDSCESAARVHLTDLFSAIREFPSEYLPDMVLLPFASTMEHSLADIMLLPYARLISATARVNYIRSLYGDPELDQFTD